MNGLSNLTGDGIDCLSKDFADIKVDDGSEVDTGLALPKVSKRTSPKGKRGKKGKDDHPLRPTFYMYDNMDNPVRAAGIIPYAMKNDKLHFLVINRNDRYEDFGGKTSQEDITLTHTILREAYEESNGIFTPPMIYDYIVNPCFIKKSKYVVYFVPISPKWMSRDFGDIEHHEQIIRKVEWVPYNKFLTNRHPRLFSKNFVDRVKNLSRSC